MVAVRGLGGQHAVFDLGDEVDEVLDFLVQRRVLVVLRLVGVHGLCSRAGLDRARHRGRFYLDDSVRVLLQKKGIQYIQIEGMDLILQW